MASVAKSVRRVACSGWKAGVTVSRVRLQYGGSRTRVGFGVAGGGGTSRLLMQAGRRLQSTNSSAAASDARGLGLGGKLFFGSLVAGTLGAGSWQLSRYQWKVGLIETIQEQLALPPIELPPFPNGTTAELESFKHRRVMVQGEFLHDQEMRIGPRTAPADVPEGSGLPRAGENVVTPFLVSNGSTVLVNRGWCPKGATVEQPKGIVQLTGVVQQSEARPKYMPDNDFAAKKLWWLDAQGIADHLGLVPVCKPTTAASSSVISQVKYLTGPLLEDIVHGDDLWVVEFHTSWCKRCKEFKETFDEASNQALGLAKFGAADCSAHPSLAKQFKLKSYPTLLVFNPRLRTVENDGWELYTGERTLQGMQELVQKHVGIMTKAQSDTTASEEPRVWVLDAVGTRTLGQYPMPKEATSFTHFYVTPAKHMVYAVTWFSLALAGAIMTRRLARRPPSHHGRRPRR